MDRYKETFETWNKVASLYEDKFMDLDLYNDSYDFICNLITKDNAKLLEIGCGPGNITKYLLSKRPDFNIFGIDIAPNMIELAKKNNPAASFAMMDSSKFPTLKQNMTELYAFSVYLIYRLQTEKYLLPTVTIY
jgi:trans-aconitate methyltransferase